MSLPGQFEVGQLYLDSLTAWSSRVDTAGRHRWKLVFPQLPTQMNWFQRSQLQRTRPGICQWPMAYPAQYYAGCGHPLNCWEVYQYADPYNDNAVMALICCPMCSFISGDHAAGAVPVRAGNADALVV